MKRFYNKQPRAFKGKVLISLMSLTLLVNFENAAVASVGADCAGMNHPAYQDEYRACVNADIAIAATNAGVDCVECLFAQKEKQTSTAVELASVLAQPVAAVAMTYLGASYGYKTQKAWANAYASGNTECTNRFNSYLNYNVERGSNPITTDEASTLNASCNGNSMGSYAGYGGLSGNGYGGYGNAFQSAGYSSAYLGGLMGPYYGTSGVGYGTGYGTGLGVGVGTGLSSMLGYGNGLSINGSLNIGTGLGTGYYPGMTGIGATYPTIGVGGNVGIGSMYPSVGVGSMYPNIGIGGNIGIGSMYPNIGVGGNVGIGSMYPNIGVGGNVGIGSMYPSIGVGGNVGIGSMYPNIGVGTGVNTGVIYPGNIGLGMGNTSGCGILCINGSLNIGTGLGTGGVNAGTGIYYPNGAINAGVNAGTGIYYPNGGLVNGGVNAGTGIYYPNGGLVNGGVNTGTGIYYPNGGLVNGGVNTGTGIYYPNGGLVNGGINTGVNNGMNGNGIYYPNPAVNGSAGGGIANSGLLNGGLNGSLNGSLNGGINTGTGANGVVINGVYYPNGTAGVNTGYNNYNNGLPNIYGNGMVNGGAGIANNGLTNGGYFNNTGNTSAYGVGGMDASYYNSQAQYQAQAQALYGQNLAISARGQGNAQTNQLGYQALQQNAQTAYNDLYTSGGASIYGGSQYSGLNLGASFSLTGGITPLY
jgi:hypothetical protein